MKKLLLGLALGVALMVGCSGTPAENRSYNGVVVNRIGTFGSSFKNDALYIPLPIKVMKFIIVSNGYKGGVSVIQINK